MKGFSVQHKRPSRTPGRKIQKGVFTFGIPLPVLCLRYGMALFCLMTYLACATNASESETLGEAAQVQVFENDRVRLDINCETGRFDVYFEGRLTLRQAVVAVMRGDEQDLTVAADDGVPWTCETSGPQDGVQTVTMTRPAALDLGAFEQTFTLQEVGGGLLVDLRYVPCPSDTVFWGLFPAYTGREAPGSGLFVGEHPESHRVVQSGSDFFMDVHPRILPGDFAFDPDRESGEPSPYSNWNNLIHDLSSGWQFLSGHLSFDKMVTGIYTEFDYSEPAVVDGDRVGFTEHGPLSIFVYKRDVTDWPEVNAETVFLNLTQGSPHEALEDYADRVAAHYQIVLPSKVPSGWDSWYVYGEQINQQIITDNLNALVDKFGPYGIDSLQIDMSWYPKWGDWEADPAKFPDGMDAMAQTISSAGLKPELWIAAFSAEDDSDLVASHPDWFSTPNPFIGQTVPEQWEVLDLTNPEVIGFLQDTAEQVIDWGYESVKFDFSYVSLFVDHPHDLFKTRIEAFRDGLQSFRSGLGPSTYFINISMTGINTGLVDSMRIGLDSWPCWGDVEGEECPYFPLTTGPYAAGVRPGVRTLARRYHYHNRVWHLHPDQVFFRDHLSFEAQRAWATVVGLSGGLVSLGDEAYSLSAEGEDVFRRLLPVLGKSSTPVDLLDREYPEVWHLDLSEYTPQGHVFGLYNWGSNVDMTQNPYVTVPEEERTVTADLAALGLNETYLGFEFWTEQYLGEVEGSLSLSIPARDSRVVVLRPKLGHPQILSSNRHVSHGANDLSDVSWEPASQQLAWVQKVVEGFPHRVRLYTAGYEVTQADVSQGSADVSFTQNGEITTLEIVPGADGEVELTVSFEMACTDNDGDGYGNPASTGCTFPDTDCDDDDPDVHPGMPEVPGNGVDDDCDPNTPPWGTPASTLEGVNAPASKTFNCLIPLVVSLAIWRCLRRKHREKSQP